MLFDFRSVQNRSGSLFAYDETISVGICIKKMQTAKMYGCKLHTDKC